MWNVYNGKMKKIFILTGEPSGDKLASKVIKTLQSSRSDIKYLSVGGENLKKIGIESLYDLKSITYIGFTNVFLNIFKIKKKINQTADKIINFNPDILFSVDSPDFTLRVAKIVKKKKPTIKTIHFVAPQVWLWRSGRVKKIKSFIDHILLLFNFEKSFFDKENIKSTFVGHPLLDNNNVNSVNSNSSTHDKPKIISLFPGSRISEIRSLMPILSKFIILLQKNNNNYSYFFHCTKEYKNDVQSFLLRNKLKNCEVISDQNAKKNILSQTFFAIAKSGTISLEISNAQVPSIIIYKMNFINFFIVKLLVNTKYANIFNIISKTEIIPELLQSNCNAFKIYEVFSSFVKNPELIQNQLLSCNIILKEIKNKNLSTKTASDILSANLS
jgi:lipid-A-disaccharide synthase